jgi:hypothetical protein
MDLEQRLSFFGGKLKLHIGTDDVLVVTHKKMMNTSHTKYLLDNIDPRYESFRHFSISSAMTSIIFLTISVYSWWYGTTHHQAPDDGIYWFVSFISFIIFLTAGVKALQSRVNVVCFNAHDGRRLFSVLGNKPSTKYVKEFCDQLGKRIERIHYNGEFSSERTADILTKHVEYLFEQNILSESEVKLALDRISNKAKLNVVSIAKDEAV